MNDNIQKNYNLYYYDDNRQKHFVYNTSLNDLNFIKDRFGKDNVKVLEIEPRQRVISA